jgi:transcriptional antiterminator NusG
MSDDTETAAAESAPPAEVPVAEAPVAEPAVETSEVAETAAPPASDPATGTVTESVAEVPATEPAVDAPATEEVAPVEVTSEVAPVAPVEVASEPAPADPEPEPVAEEKPKAKRKSKAKAESEPEPAVAAVAVADPAGADAPPVSNKKWYAIKVTSGREDTVKAALLRKVRIEGLEDVVGRIEIPVEEKIEKKQVRVKDKKTGEYTYQERKVTKRTKKFYGYIFVELEFNDRTLYLMRETSGVGGFLTMREGKKGEQAVPDPMPDHEVQSMLTGVAVKDPLKKVKVKLDFEKGDKVRIKDGSFANSEGEVKEIREAADPTEVPKVKVELTFWGRPLEVELDASQVEKV